MENRLIPSNTVTPDTLTKHPPEPHKKRTKGRQKPLKSPSVELVYSDFDELLVDMWEIGGQVVTVDLFYGLERMLKEFTREEIAFAYLAFVNGRGEYRDYRMGEESECLPYFPRDFLIGGRAIILAQRQHQERACDNQVDAYSPHQVANRDERRCGFLPLTGSRS